jgi:predicted PurR-regulated permease PerM
LTGVLGVLANLFFILLLSFYITIDGARLRGAVLNRVPTFFIDEISFFSKSVDRTFGGFLRGQLIQAGLVSIITTLAMSILGLQFALTAGLFAGLFMLIPMVGPFLALIPPALATVVQAPNLAFGLVLVLFIFQFGLTNVVMPRFLGQALGLHPLLVFAAILFGVKIGGFWGAFFGIPVAGVIWAMALYFFDKWRQERASDEAQKQNLD